MSDSQLNSNKVHDFSMENELNRLRDMFWLRIATIGCMFLAALSVLDAFVVLVSHLAFLSGSLTTENDPAYKAFIETIEQAPYYYMTLNLYQIIMWNLILLASLWLFRYLNWARRALVMLLGIDMIVTVLLLLGEAVNGQLKINQPGWFLVLNATQVLLIIVLSHPRMIAITESFSLERKPEDLTRQLEESLREKGDRD